MAESKTANIEFIEQRAFEIYQTLLAGPMQGFDHEHISLEAYRRAAAFQAVTEKVKAGTVSYAPQAAKPRQMVDVRLKRARPEGNEFIDILDSQGNPIIKQMPADPYAYCPNLPADHPANQRFVPEDGVSFASRVTAHRKAMKLSVN